MNIAQKSLFKYYILILLLLLSFSKAQSQVRFAISTNYIYSMKWHRDAYYAYYTDVPNNHSGSIQFEGLHRLSRVFSTRENSWDHISLGVYSEMIYLPYSGIHYKGYEFLANVNGINQYIHHYDHDRFKFMYLVTGIKVKYEMVGVGYISFLKAYPFQLIVISQNQELNLNNITGEGSYGSWAAKTSDRIRNPGIFTELSVGLKMSSSSYFVFGFQWTARSAINLVHTQHHVDNRERAFRNVKLGWQFSLQ